MFTCGTPSCSTLSPRRALTSNFHPSSPAECDSNALKERMAFAYCHVGDRSCKCRGRDKCPRLTSTCAYRRAGTRARHRNTGCCAMGMSSMVCMPVTLLDVALCALACRLFCAIRIDLARCYRPGCSACLLASLLACRLMLHSTACAAGYPDKMLVCCSVHVAPACSGKHVAWLTPFGPLAATCSAARDTLR